jgi:hypothetical protein
MQSAGGAITRASHARSTSDHRARHDSRPGFQETSMSEILGGCRCDAVRYALALDGVPPTYACHCPDCQTWSGSAFSQQTYLPEVALSVTGRWRSMNSPARAEETRDSALPTSAP